MIISHFSKFIILIFIFIPHLINAQHTNEFFTKENRIKFGNHLFCEGDYIRAIDEYSIINSIENNDSLQFKIALSFQKLSRYEEAKSIFKEKFENSNLNREANIEYFRTIYLANDFDLLRKKYFSLAKINNENSSDVRKLYSVSQLYSSQNTLDSSEFFKYFDEKESIELLKFYLRKQKLNMKSPALAALLSTAIPGLGKIYTENYGDGITSLLLTGILTFLSIDNFNANHNFRAWFFAGLAAYFYAGNIYGSAVSAQLYNANIRMSFDNDLEIFLNNNNHFIQGSKWFCN